MHWWYKNLYATGRGIARSDYGANMKGTSSADHDDALQELHGLVNGRVGVKSSAGSGKFVVQDGLQLLSQAIGFLLQLGLLLLSGQSVLLQLLVVPVTLLSVTQMWLCLIQHVNAERVWMKNLPGHCQGKCQGRVSTQNLLVSLASTAWQKC